MHAISTKVGYHSTLFYIWIEIAFMKQFSLVFFSIGMIWKNWDRIDPSEFTVYYNTFFLTYITCMFYLLYDMLSSFKSAYTVLMYDCPTSYWYMYASIWRSATYN